MDALITAGGVPNPDELLYPYTQGGLKVLLQIGSKPIIQWVIDALNQSEKISSIFIVGLPKTTKINSRKPITFVPAQGDLLANIQAGAEALLAHNPAMKTALMVSADIPGLTGEMVDWLVEKALQDQKDIHYTVIDKKVMDKVFPSSRRTFMRLKDMELSGGDMSAFDPRVVLDLNAKWRKLIANRKNPLKQAALIGFGTLFLVFTRQITLRGLEKRVCRNLKINGRVLVCPYPEVGMDVDKPNQLELMRSYLAG